VKVFAKTNIWLRSAKTLHTLLLPILSIFSNRGWENGSATRELDEPISSSGNESVLWDAEIVMQARVTVQGIENDVYIPPWIMKLV
jgi:hypothetical protein